MILTEIPIRISSSTTSTLTNKTGFWRYVRPAFVMKTAPCSAACPAGEDIARVENLVRQGYYRRALECILMENPFPAVCGRVCFHPCEGACNRASFDEAVSIRCVERFLGDGAVFNRVKPAVFRFPPNGKNVAVVGAGPAGLSAAYFLALLGYGCTVYEAENEAGGVLRWGIPDYRLPVSVLAFEVDRIRQMGVAIRCGERISTQTLSALENDYDAVFLGCGHGRRLSMGIPGEAHALDGLALLSDVKKGKKPGLNGSVAVIGGGNTAVDVSRTLIRLGVDVTLVYRRRRQDMPAFDHEVALAVEEGVSLVELSAPVRLEKNDAGLKLHLQRMKVSEMGPGGRARVAPDGSGTAAMRVGHVIAAIGAQADEIWKPASMASEVPLVFSHCTAVSGSNIRVYGGDLTNPEKTVAHAVASGKQAAMVMDMMLSENAVDPEGHISKYQVGGGLSVSMEMYIGGERKNRDSRVVSFADINTDYFDASLRVAPPLVSLDNMEDAFGETEQTFAQGAADAEAGRCFNCGICNGCDNCRLFCPEMAVVRMAGEKDRAINTDYCKGCGICVTECPRNAMSLTEEQA